MNTDRYIRKYIRYGIVYLIIGLAGACIGLIAYVSDFRSDAVIGTAIGLASGFIPVGLFFLLFYRNAGNDPEKLKKIEAENEERNIFINTKAGRNAFWVTYSYMAASTILSTFVAFSFRTFMIVTLLFMPVLYFTFNFIFHRKY